MLAIRQSSGTQYRKIVHFKAYPLHLYLFVFVGGATYTAKQEGGMAGLPPPLDPPVGGGGWPEVQRLTGK